MSPRERRTSERRERTESPTRRRAQHLGQRANRLARNESNRCLLLDRIVERLRRRLTLLVLLILILLLALVLTLDVSLGLRLRLVTLLLHTARRTRDVEPHFAHLVRHRTQPLLLRHGVFGVARGRRREGRAKLECDFGFRDRGVLDDVEGNRERGLARDEEGEVVGCASEAGKSARARAYIDSSFRRAGSLTGERSANSPCTSATPQFHPLTLMSFVSIVML